MSFPDMMTKTEMKKRVTRIPLMSRLGNVTTVAQVKHSCASESNKEPSGCLST